MHLICNKSIPVLVHCKHYLPWLWKLLRCSSCSACLLLCSSLLLSLILLLITRFRCILLCCRVLLFSFSRNILSLKWKWLNIMHIHSVICSTKEIKLGYLASPINLTQFQTVCTTCCQNPVLHVHQSIVPNQQLTLKTYTVM